MIFIKTHLILLLLCFFQLSSCTKVVIVGAGVSGLSAARTLSENGFTNFTILEANDRIGGRIHTTEFKGHMYERGAQWIHGADGNALYDYMSEDIKLEIESWGRYSPAKDSKFQYYSGRPITSTIKRLFWSSSDLLDYIELEIERLIEKKGKSEQEIANLPLGAVARKMWKKKFVDRYTSLDKDVTHPVLVNKFGLLELTDSGHPDIVNSLAWYQYTEYGDNDIKVLDGFMSLPKKLSKNIPKNTIKLKSRVKRIYWDEENKISMGCLKKYHKAIFKPSLPFDKQAAIQKIGFGTMNKMLLFYEKTFWGPEKFPERYLLWDSYKDLPRGATQDEFADKHHWCRDVYKISSYGKNFLLLWLTKENSKRIRTIQLNEIKSTTTNLLRRFLNDPKLPGPEKIITTEWDLDKNFLGSYSYPAIGQMPSDQVKAGEPLYVNGKPRVLFAGEAFSISRYSTVDGAFSTGQSEGERMLRIFEEERD